MLYSGIPKIVCYFHRLHTIRSYYKILTISLVLCISSLGLIYFVTGSLYLSIPFTYFTSPPTSLPFGNTICSLCLYSFALFFGCHL